MRASSFFTGPHHTPRSIKRLIWAIALVSLGAPILTFFFAHFFNLPGPGAWFTLSLLGIKKGWLWQPFTYFFLQSAGVGITLSLLFSLAFHLFLIWFVGSELVGRFTTRSFLLFFFGAGVFAGWLSTAALLLFGGQSTLAGSGPPLYASLIVWAMLYPDLELFFLFFIRFKSKLLVAILLGLALLINLSFGEFLSFWANLMGIIWGFCYGRFIWKLPNPYPLNLELPKKKPPPSEGKVIDITVFQESDDDFMDRMLEKIARKGTDALTEREKKRMDIISKKSK